MIPTSAPSLTPLSVAQALAYYRDMKAVAKNAPYGQFLNDAEAVALSQGREFIRQSLATIAQEEIDDSERKRNENVSEMSNEKTASGYRNKNAGTAAGTVKLKRRYDECPPCNLPEHAIDEPRGITDDTVGFRSLAVRAGTDWIWDIVRLEFGRVRERLDVYHALEHLSKAGKVLHGVETEALRDSRHQTAEK